MNLNPKQSEAIDHRCVIDASHESIDESQSESIRINQNQSESIAIYRSPTRGRASPATGDARLNVFARVDAARAFAALLLLRIALTNQWMNQNRNQNQSQSIDHRRATRAG